LLESGAGVNLDIVGNGERSYITGSQKVVSFLDVKKQVDESNFLVYFTPLTYTTRNTSNSSLNVTLRRALWLRT